MRVLLPSGEVDPRLANDPRLSESQVDAIEKIARADHAATLLGLDEKLRPVVSARLDGPGRRTRTAFLRNGSPTAAGKLTERWPPTAVR